MNKKKLLEEIENFAKKKVIRKEEVLAAYAKGASASSSGGVEESRSKIAEILYYIGGGVVFVGISVLIWQNWSALNVFGRILATFGAGLAAYFVGLFLGVGKRFKAVSRAFYFISALVTPVGLYVVFDSVGFEVGRDGTQSLIAAILLTAFLLSFFVLKEDIFLLFGIIFGTWLFFALTNLVAAGAGSYLSRDFFAYRSMFAGLSYVLLGYSFMTRKPGFVAPLYGFGILGFLGSAFALGGWNPNQNVFWEVAFPGLALGTVFLSVYLKSRSFLVFGSFFLMMYILKITAEYFSKGLGWPLALVLAGLALIALGYFSFYLNRRYIA